MIWVFLFIALIGTPAWAGITSTNTDPTPQGTITFIPEALHTTIAGSPAGLGGTVNVGLVDPMTLTGMTLTGPAFLNLGVASTAYGAMTFFTGATAHTTTFTVGSVPIDVTFTWPTQDGSNGDCLVTDGAGHWHFASTCGGAAGGINSLNGQTGSTQTFTNDINVTMTSASNVHALGWTGTLGLARGGCHTDLSGTGGPSKFLRQNAAGADCTVVQPAFTDLSGTIALAQIPDAFITNVKLVNSTITVTGTTSQVNASGSPVSLGGTVTLSTPQNIDTAATIQFSRMGLGVAADADSHPYLYLSQSGANPGATNVWQAYLNNRSASATNKPAGLRIFYSGASGNWTSGTGGDFLRFGDGGGAPHSESSVTDYFVVSGNGSVTALGSVTTPGVYGGTAIGSQLRLQGSTLATSTPTSVLLVNHAATAANAKGLDIFYDNSGGNWTSGTGGNFITARDGTTYFVVSGAGVITVGGYAASSITTTYTDAKLKTLTGTANRITIGGSATDPTVDIAATYVGQTSITTLGTITTGTWHGTIIERAFGGWGSDVSGSTGVVSFNSGTPIFNNVLTAGRLL